MLKGIMIPLSNSRSANIKSGQKSDALEGRAGVEAQHRQLSETRIMKTMQASEPNREPMPTARVGGRSQAPHAKAKRPEHIKLRCMHAPNRDQVAEVAQEIKILAIHRAPKSLKYHMTNIQTIRKNRGKEMVANLNQELPERRSKKRTEDKTSQFQGRRSTRNQSKLTRVDQNRLRVANKGSHIESIPAMRQTGAEIREINPRAPQERAIDEVKTAPRNLPPSRATFAHLCANPAINGTP